MLLLATVLAARWALAAWARHRLERAIARVERLAGSLDPQRLAPPAVPDERNAARWLLAGGEAVAADEAQLERLRSFRKDPASRWAAADVAAARLYVAERGHALERLQMAAVLEASDFGISREPWPKTELSTFIGVHRLASLGFIAGRLALADGDYAAFRQASVNLTRAAAALCRESTLLTSMLGESVQRAQLALVRDFLDAGAPDVPLAQFLLDEVEGDPCQGALRRGLVAKAVALAAWREDEPRVRRRLAISGVLWPRFWAPIAGPVEGAIAIERVAGLIERLDLPLDAYKVAYDEELSRLRPWERTLDMPSPYPLEFVQSSKATETSRAMAAAALRVAVFRAEQGHFPESLSLERTPYVGEVPSYEVGEGWAEVAAPASEALWKELNANYPGRPPIFRWRVPSYARTAKNLSATSAGEPTRSSGSPPRVQSAGRNCR